VRAETISTIIPVYNGATFIAEAVASIRAQKQPVAEIIVVDDGSTDGSAEVAAALGDDIRVVQHPVNQGVAAAINTGVAEARGDLLAFLDVDDLWGADKQARQLELACLNPSAEIIVGHMQKLTLVASDSGERRFVPWGEPQLALSVGASLFRRGVFDRIGRFDSSLAHSLDWDWFMRAREQQVGIKVHRDVVLYYRRHGANMTEDAEGNRNTLAMLRRSLQRRREAAGGQADSLPQLRPD
jgi:glycosyltransferase involved in cell wall biosynthesis